MAILTKTGASLTLYDPGGGGGEGGFTSPPQKILIRGQGLVARRVSKLKVDVSFRIFFKFNNS